MLIINIDESNTTKLKRIYYKNRSRLPTMTDVNIVSENLIVGIHRICGKIYLIEIDNQLKNYNIIDTLKIVYGNNKIETEMLSRKDNHLYIITFTEYLLMVDIIDNKKLNFVKTIKLNTTGNQYHGIDIYDNNLYIVPAVVANNPTHILKINTNNIENNIEKIITNEFRDNTGKYRIKDISFFEDGKMIILIMINNGKTNMTINNHVDNGFIGLYDNNFNQLDVYLFSEVHLDSVAIIGNDFYVPLVENKGSFIYKCSINNNKINKNIKKYKIVDFPHGIDIYKSKNKTILGYTSYQSSSIYLIDLDKLDEELEEEPDQSKI